MNGLSDDVNNIYKSMVECISDCAIFMLDVNGHIVTWNAGAEHITGYREAEIVGQHFSVLYPIEDARSGKPERELMAAAEKGPFEDQGWRLRKDGTRFWADVSINAMRTRAGELYGFVKLTRDLTEQKLLEDELRRSQERFESAMEWAPNAKIMFNPAGRIVMLNLQAERMFGYSRDELLGEPVEMLIPERFRQQHLGHRLSFFADPKSRRMNARRGVCALTKDGAEFPVEIGLNLMETAEGTMVLAAIVDITERKLNEEALLRSEERFRCAVEACPAAMLMTDRSGRIVMVNRETERIFGYPREELLERSIEMLVPKRFRQRHVGFRESFFADPKRRAVVGSELYGLRKDGSEVPLEIGLNPVETEEGLMVLAAIIDVNDRERKKVDARHRFGL